MSRQLKFQRPRQISWRLSNGLSRVNIGHRLPPDVKDAVTAIAFKENKSVGWVLENVIISWFRLPKPEYIKPKTLATDEKKTKEKKGREAAERVAASR